MSLIRDIDINKNALGLDAWGRNKTITDRSILHGMFSFNVPVNIWKETFNGVEQAFTNATSVDGALNLVSGSTLNDKTNLESFRKPRYQPNRGYLYSTALIMPDVSNNGVRRFGAATDENGVYFELDNTGLYACVRTTTTGGGTTVDRQSITTTGIDLSKGNVYDIQFQWRGVGNYKFYINLELVYEFKYLGTRTELSMANPALPAFYECENTGDEVEMIVGCVDITSEGGDDNGKQYGSIGLNNNTGQVAISSYNIPIVAVRSKLTIGGLINTRDTLALLASAYADNKCVFRVWATRDFTAITPNSQTWTDFGDGHLEYIVNDGTGGQMTFNTAGLTPVFTCRVNQDDTYATSALFEGRTEIWQTVGDMFVFTMHRENGGSANVGVTYEFAEEI